MSSETDPGAADATRLSGAEHFRRLIEHAHDLIVIVDEDGLAHYGSPSVRRVLGYDPAVVDGGSLFPLIHPDDVPSLRRWLAGLAAAPGVVQRLEYRFRHADGHWVYLEAVSVAPADYRPRAGHVINVRDVTERHEAEAALRRAKSEADRARDAAERAAARDRLLADVSHLLAASLDGATALAQVAGRLVPELADGCAWEGTAAAAADASGDDRWASVVRASLGDGHGARHESLVLGRAADRAPFDDEDRALAAEVARRAGQALEHARLFRATHDAIAARDRVLAVVAHDLRGPLTAMRFDVEMLRLDPAGPIAEPDAATLARVERAAARMDRLIEDLLDVSRLGRDVLALDRRPYDVGALLAEAATTLRPLVEGQGLRFEARGAATLPPASVDPARLLQAVSNLVGNAAKFAAPGGAVTLTWTAAAANGRPELRITVHDDGPGIPPDQLQHIFGAFWQARHADRRGLGLGLAIAKGIVEAHGGRIWVESAPGEGSAFVIALPLDGDA